MRARSRRTLRGTGAAAIATWVAAVSHNVGGGSAPTPLMLLVVTALAAPLAVTLAGRRLGLIRITLTVVATQVLLHVAFAATAGLDPSLVTGHVHNGLLPAGGDAASFLPDAGMFLAHAIAAVVTVLVLYRGEQLLTAIRRGLARLVALPADPAVPVAVRPGRARSVRPSAVADHRFVFDLPRRGPPATVVAA